MSLADRRQPTLGSLEAQALRQRLAGAGLRLRTGPFRFRIRSVHEGVAEGLGLLYPDMPLAGDGDFVDFDVSLAPGRGVHRWWHRQARFLFDGQSPFEPLPQSQAFPLLEWGMNWCISSHAHWFLIVHAAVLERNGGALLLPAPPGSGKSTLCAALMHSGWRLLSDELALVSVRDGRIWPLCRPVSLKNASIEVMRAFVPSAVFSPEVRETSKGRVAHLRVPSDHVLRMEEPAVLRWIVFPRYRAEAPMQAQPRSRASTVVAVGRNAFNINLFGRDGFDLICRLVAGAQCFDFEYSRLGEAMQWFCALADTGWLPPEARPGACDARPGERVRA
ncbi:MAG: HprK-related kinase A [Burkholderiaceae bacterium]|nr:HprK-related kinase A [Burkholderiaceae bacterium]